MTSHWFCAVRTSGLSAELTRQCQEMVNVFCGGRPAIEPGEMRVLRSSIPTVCHALLKVDALIFNVTGSEMIAFAIQG